MITIFRIIHLKAALLSAAFCIEGVSKKDAKRENDALKCKFQRFCFVVS